jgi:tRNA A58 N-methylase Trm61
MRSRHIVAIALGLGIFAIGAILPSPNGTIAEVKPDAPYVPTPDAVVQRMLEVANVGANDIVYDLGSGDGRLAIAAVKDFGAARAIGIEIQPELVEKARANAKAAGVSDRVEFRQQDLFQTDLSEASVVTIYLLTCVCDPNYYRNSNQALASFLIRLVWGTGNQNKS